MQRLISGPALALMLAAWAASGLAIWLSASRANERRTEAHARSAALFVQMAPVLQSPRCMNCHTSTEFPRQGDDRHRHIMSVVRGPADHGVPALQCQACHHDKNSAATGVPGAPDWHLAPLSMAWEGLSVGQLCRLILDPHKGGISPDQFVPHLQTDLVQWAWSPGNDLDGHPRMPPPIARDRFIALAQQWVGSGASCPQ
ncbi:MAG TPA: hypothetical protein VHB49_08595 [Bradyrhizobium sp.]|nr:hypothetical protein [Bradyrhizobium sp.]